MKLKILGIKPAVSKADKIYYKVSTNRGEMTAFDEDIVKELTPGKDVNLNVVPSADGRYQNIRGFAMDDAEDNIESLETAQSKGIVVKPQEFGKSKIYNVPTNTPIRAMSPPVEFRKSVKGSAYEKDPVGLAVEVFNSHLLSNMALKDIKSSVLMDNSIELVKQAQEAFR